MKMIVYQALYCSCIFESGYDTLSIHLSEEGAIKAMHLHKTKRIKENYKSEEEALEYEAWTVKKVGVFE